MKADSLEIEPVGARRNYGPGLFCIAKFREKPVDAIRFRGPDFSSPYYQMLLDEIQIMQGWRSPYIVQIVAFKSERILLQEPLWYTVVMEPMSKGCLFHVLHDSTEELPWKQRWQIATDIGHGFAYIHDQGTSLGAVSSYMITATNGGMTSCSIFLDEHYRAKITNESIQGYHPVTSKSSAAPGTPTRWRAPETCKDPKTPHTPASDIYTYGVILWEIASRKIPYEGKHNDYTVKDWIRTGKKESIPTSCPEIYGKIIESTWNQDPSNRPTAKEITEVFEQNATDMWRPAFNK